MHYQVRHRTAYQYESSVLHGQHVGRLRPRDTETQSVANYAILCEPGGATMRQRRDYFGNHVVVVDVLDAHERFVLESRFTVRTREQPQLSLPGLRDAKLAWDDCVRELALMRSEHLLQDFRYDSPLVRAHPALRDYASPSFPVGRPLRDAVVELNQRIHADFVYDPTATDVSTPLATVMRERKGVCQDFAHVAVGCLRSLGLAARYVSGYLETRPPPGRPRLVGADASHAWASVFIPVHGWIDFDPTNGVLPGERHVTVAWGRDFSDVSPLKGVILGGGAHQVHVGVDVEPLEPDAE